MKTWAWIVVCVTGAAFAQGPEQFYMKSGPVGSPQDACVPADPRLSPQQEESQGVSEGYVKTRPATSIQDRQVVLTVKSDGSVVDCVFLGETADYYPQGAWVLYNDEWYQIRTDPCSGGDAAYSYSDPSAQPIRVIYQRSN